MDHDIIAMGYTRGKHATLICNQAGLDKLPEPMRIMNRLHFILIMLNIFAFGMLAGVKFNNYNVDAACEKDTNFHIGDQEYACIKLPGVITEEQANDLQNN